MGRSRSCSQTAASSGSTSTSPPRTTSRSFATSSASTRSPSRTPSIFNQRAKIDDYDDFVFIVVYGAAPDDDRLVEVHCFYSERFLVTVHRDDCPAFAEIRERFAKREAPIQRPALLLYRIIDGLVNSFFPILADFDDRIDELEDAIFLKADDRQLQEIFQMKRLLVGMRKAVTPQRDTFARLMGGVAHADHDACGRLRSLEQPGRRRRQDRTPRRQRERPPLGRSPGHLVASRPMRSGR